MEIFQTNLLKSINDLAQKVERLESELRDLKKANHQDSLISKYHLLRVKNNEELSDQFILDLLPYRDLSPEKSFELYGQKDIDFVFLDVSSKNFESGHDIPEAINIPLEEIEAKHLLLGSKNKSVFVISEKGTRSILACKKLVELGYYNLNNISGGHKFWPQGNIEHLPAREKNLA